jgi:hypothetical protein
VTIVVRDGMSGPLKGTPDAVLGWAGREQAIAAATVKRRKARPATRAWGIERLST